MPDRLRPAELRPTGGVIETPATGSTRLEMITFNTGEKGLKDSNASHAERQFHQYLERNQAVGTTVTQIDATITLSPCTLCTKELNDIADRLTPAADGRRYLRWINPWRGSGATTDSSLARTKGWHITPSTVPPRTPGKETVKLSIKEWEPIIEAEHAKHPAPGSVPVPVP
jgi:hypothetical protein